MQTLYLGAELMTGRFAAAPASGQCHCLFFCLQIQIHTQIEIQIQIHLHLHKQLQYHERLVYLPVGGRPATRQEGAPEKGL